VASAARARIAVTGIVQGVGYRWTAAREAQRRGLRGFVRNLPDGRVELLAEGERAQVESLLAWCWSGPPAARVSGVVAEWSEARGDLPGFDIEP
jgi:acylphosphatase